MNIQELDREDRPAPRPGRETFLSLARQPMVQMVLITAAAAQVVSVATREETGADRALNKLVPAVELEAMTVMPDPAVEAAWLEAAITRESERLAAEYREQGFNVSSALARQIGKAAAEFEIEPQVAFGLVRAESSFRNQATSRVGAVGLTQLMPRTAAWMEPGVTRSQLRDPETNLRIGFMYLRYLLDKYDGNESLALVAYNRGPGTVDRELRRGRNPDNGYADFVYGKENHGHRLFTR